MTPTEKSTQNKREEMRGGKVPEGREVYQESRDLLTGLRKCKPPPPFTQRERTLLVGHKLPMGQK